MAHEFNESFNAPVESSQNMGALGDYAMVRQDQQLAKFDRQMNANLVDAGLLPAMELSLTNGDDAVIELKNPFKTDITTKQLKDSGVKATETLNDDGTKSITAETKNGVRVTVSEGSEKTMPSGNKVKISESVMIEPNGQIRPKDKEGNVWVDAKGREVVRKNDDGSVTIDTGDGGFVKVDSQGVKKISAIRSRDGKTFEEIDTDSPLGNLRPPQIPVRK
jgi:hypothetical protein